MATSYDPIVAKQYLNQYWGYTEFKAFQEPIIASIVSGKDTVALLPTGGGKSICYQLTALLLDGMCLVISPLIALMTDQVNRLLDAGIDAACIHAGLTRDQTIEVLNNAVKGEYKLLYVAPERLRSRQFQQYLRQCNICCLAIDEAHCISQWGHDFRPSYLQIADIKKHLPQVPILALTATATPAVQEDIILQLGLKEPSIFKQSFARPNIKVSVVYSEHKLQAIKDMLQQDCSIIYCRSRRHTEEVATAINEQEHIALSYHAGMPRNQRTEHQHLWMTGERPIMVATTAFGMGIDKPDVRSVIHYDVPEHLEAWYQEIGRAGRDGAPSVANTLYNATDIQRLQNSIEISYPTLAYIQEVYQYICDYFQIAAGVEVNKYYKFDVYVFCKQFQLQVLPVLGALKVLERLQFWTLTDAVFKPGAVQFTTNRDSIDELQERQPNLGYLAIGLLRMYPAIFHYPIPIRESAIAHQLKMPIGIVKKHLEQLHQMEYILYQPPAETAQIYIHHIRLHAAHLRFDMKHFNELKKQHIARIEQLTAFLEEQHICRQNMILSYFGEEVKAPCGQCDNCIRQTTRVACSDIKLLIFEQIQLHRPTVMQLVSLLKHLDRDDVLANIRSAIDNAEITIGPQKRLQLKH